MKDETGRTREEKNEAVDHPVPVIIIPTEGIYLVEWFDELMEGVNRVRDNHCEVIPWTEYLAWSKVTGRIVRPPEYAILKAMDQAYCKVMNEELIDLAIRQAETVKNNRTPME